MAFLKGCIDCGNAGEKNDVFPADSLVNCGSFTLLITCLGKLQGIFADSYFFRMFLLFSIFVYISQFYLLLM